VVPLALVACGGDDAGSDSSVAAAPTTAATTTAATDTDAPATQVPSTEAPEAPTTAAPATEAPTEPLRVLVTNDDGVGADGIDALVQGLLTIEGLEVTVVAPRDDRTGTGGSTTDGPLTATETTTASGYPAIAVDGFPADTIVWAIDQGGIDFVPDLVVSGINEGQNIGPLVDVSGTVGAARAAAQRGIPAVAVSQGIVDETIEPDYPSGVEAILAWLDANLDDIAAHEPGDPVSSVVGINVPTCLAGTEIRGTLEVPVATAIPEGVNVLADIDCASTVTDPPDDVQAFINGFVAISPVPLAPAG
jgi:5'-nucleotidase